MTMTNETKIFLEYLLKQNQLPIGFNLDSLVAQKEILQQKMDNLRKQGKILEFDPIFAHYQIPLAKK